MQIWCTPILLIPVYTPVEFNHSSGHLSEEATPGDHAGGERQPCSTCRRSRRHVSRPAVTGSLVDRHAGLMPELLDARREYFGTTAVSLHELAQERHYIAGCLRVGGWTRIRQALARLRDAGGNIRYFNWLSHRHVPVLNEFERYQERLYADLQNGIATFETVVAFMEEMNDIGIQMNYLLWLLQQDDASRSYINSRWKRRRNRRRRQGQLL